MGRFAYSFAFFVRLADELVLDLCLRFIFLIYCFLLGIIILSLQSRKDVEGSLFVVKRYSVFGSHSVCLCERERESERCITFLLLIDYNVLEKIGFYRNLAELMLAAVFLFFFSLLKEYSTAVSVHCNESAKYRFGFVDNASFEL